jgi:hypothetical protein
MSEDAVNKALLRFANNGAHGNTSQSCILMPKRTQPGIASHAAWHLLCCNFWSDGKHSVYKRPDYAVAEAENFSGCLHHIDLPVCSQRQ